MFSFSGFRQDKGGQNILNWIVTSTPWIFQVESSGL